MSSSSSHPNPLPAPSLTPAPKRRGSYNCGRCGLPKKGHHCPSLPLRRALSFDDDLHPPSSSPLPPPDEDSDDDSDDDELEADVGDGWTLPSACMVEILRRLSPSELLAASAVCKGWLECARRVWRAAEVLRLRVPKGARIGFVGSVLYKCAALAHLKLRMESDIDATMLACVAFSCPNLQSFEISVAENAVNRITGNELSRFVSDKRCLSTLKVDGCNNLGSLNLISSSLSTMWLSDLYCISKMAMKCSNLKELSLDFTRQENDSTDLITMLESLGSTCPLLQNLHVASALLSNDAVLALTSANLRDLRMLSLVLGSRITDAAVTAIVSCYGSLELLDLSGSGISDCGIRMICNVLSETLTRLLLAVCPNITSSGIQLATTQLPLLQLLDCGMSITCSKGHHESSKQQNAPEKLIIKHGRLRKLSLWGCSRINALYVNCPVLVDLNLISCTNLHPEKLLLQCPNLKNVHASGCQHMLIGAIRNQVLNEFAAVEEHIPNKRLADGSKRVQVPQYFQQSLQHDKLKRIRLTQCSVHHD